MGTPKSEDLSFYGENYFDGLTWIWWIKRKKWTAANQIPVNNIANPCFVTISSFQVLVFHNLGLIEMNFENSSLKLIKQNSLDVELFFKKSCALIYGKVYQKYVIVTGYETYLSGIYYTQAYLYNVYEKSWKVLNELKTSDLPIFTINNEVFQIRSTNEKLEMIKYYENNFDGRIIASANHLQLYGKSVHEIINTLSYNKIVFA